MTDPFYSLNFEEKLAQLGWSLTYLAKLTGKHVNTPSNWKRDGDAPPYIHAILDREYELRNLRSMVSYYEQRLAQVPA